MLCETHTNSEGDPMRRLSRLMRCLGLALAAGCYQPAGAPIDSAASQPTVEALPTQPTSAPDMTQAEPTAPPLVENTDVPTPLPSSTPTLTSTATPGVEILNIETIAAETRRAVSRSTPTSQPTDPDAALTLPIITATVVYITPSAPEGPIVLPSATPPPTFTPTPIGFEASTAADGESPYVVGAEGCYYVVQAGDSLYAIAIRSGLALDALREANPDINPQTLQIGQRLRLPACVDTPTPTAALPPGVEPTAAPTPQGIEYVVRAGDTLYSIAGRFRVTINAIIRVNPALQANPNLLSIGQRLIIPIDPTPAPPTSTPLPSSTPTPQATPPGSVIEPIILPSATGFGG
jgi:LysM repeat protein